MQETLNTTSETKRPLNKTKLLTYSAALSAMSMLIVMLMPTIQIGVTSFTPASHVPIMLAMMVHPIVAIATAIVTVFSFMLKGVSYPIVFRAISHIFFVVPGSFLAQIFFNKKERSYGKLTLYALLLNGITAIIHTFAEMFAVYFAFLVLADFFTTVRDIFLLVGLVTVVHSIVDFMLAFVIYLGLKRARVVNLRE